MNELGIENIAGGALAEQFDIELQRVLENISDPNTDPKKVRKLKIEIVFKPNELRNIATINFQTNSQLIPARPIETGIFIDKDTKGKVYASELAKGTIPGQMKMDNVLSIQK